MPAAGYIASPTLRRFQRSNARRRAVVGPFGSGKSTACVVETLRRATQQAPGPDGVRRTRGLIGRNTYRELEDTTRKTFESWVPRSLGRFVESDYSWVGRWSDEDGYRVETEILFRSFEQTEDIKKAKSLDLTWAWLNEASEMPREVFDILDARIGRFPPTRDGGPSWFGIWLDTNPWHTGHWGYKLFSLHKGVDEVDRATYELFEQPDGLSPAAENVGNLPDSYYRSLCVGKDQEWIDQYVRAKYPTHDKGSIFGDLVAQLEAAGRIAEFDHPRDGVFTTWDLGVSDSTAIWFWRISGEDVPIDSPMLPPAQRAELLALPQQKRPRAVRLPRYDLVDHFEDSGQPGSYYFRVVDERGVDGRGYQYVKHWLPHDARQRSWQTGVGVVDQFIEHFGASAVAIGPELSLRDGIGAARWLLEHPIRFHARCADGVEALRQYKREWDPETRSFSPRPLHDWTSHTADAFRYLACVARETERITRPPTPPKQAMPRALVSLTFDELMECLPSKRSSGRV